MRYLSTRGDALPENLSAALAAGIAPDGGLFVPEALPLVLATYAPATDPRHPWISPIRDSLERMPPLLFHAGSTEILVDDSIRAADKARVAGAVVELAVWPEMPHVFQMMNALPEARAAISGIARFVREHVPAAQPATQSSGVLEFLH